MMSAPVFPSPAEALVLLLVLIATFLVGPIVGTLGIITALLKNRGPDGTHRSKEAHRLGMIALVIGTDAIIYGRGGKYDPAAPLYALPSLVTGLLAIALALPRIKLIHLMDLVLVLAVLFGLIVTLRR